MEVKLKVLVSDVSLINDNRGGLRLVYSGSSQGWITATAGNDATFTKFICNSNWWN